jgi:GNAT superfamily N-acetyltransferase
MSNENCNGKVSRGGQARVRAATPEDASGIAHVHLESWETTYRGILPDAVLDARSYETLFERWTRTLLDMKPDVGVFVAEAGGEIVGFASGGPVRSDEPDYDGELYGIYLLQDHQSRGIGCALTRVVAAHLLRHGKHSMLVWVLSDNRSRAFYERLGGVPVRTALVLFGDVEYEETAYGWPDIRTLLPNA